MKTLYTIICTILLSTTISAQECSEDFKQVEGLWNKLTLENALNDPESMTSEFDALKGNLTKSLGNLSLKGNAPKFLPTSGKVKKGSLKKNKKRTYVTYMAPRERIEINIASTQSLAGLEVVVCSHTKSNMTQNLDSHTFIAGESSKSFTLENVKGKVLSVSLKNSGAKAPFTIVAK
ncbi:hypothetical protein G5B37_06290 [Rasiella rasia]|uniref:Uncharacterized protein n=1 Tax=Rasiella rasia TaxID=2744027 RepID=A0A6G6GNA6_9FLAO|nr:hypothetical protein [Rasiella rasia]QIE59181.1 hypothetical protein G5B37_06290 [Rasiella rasia]